MQKMRYLAISLFLLAGCSDSQPEQVDAQPSRTISHPPAISSGEPDPLVIEATPTFTLDYTYGGTVIGPEGELMDGGKFLRVLALKANGKTIRIQDPPVFPRNFMSDSNMETGKLYQFTVTRSGNTYQIAKIQDGNKLIYPKKKD